jgi:RNA polymerase sigma factor (sigma-70 family)
MTIFKDNRKLLDDFRRGKASVFRIVYKHYIENMELFVANGWYNSENGNKVYGIVDFEVQAELVQEIFMKAFSEKARMSYDGFRPYKIFLLGIARNVVVDYFRKQPRDMLTHASVDVATMNIETNADLDMIAAREHDLDWQRCIAATKDYVATLDAIHRRFVEFRFHDEMTLMEVARRLELSRGKARQLEKELGRSLKRHLQSLKLSYGRKV